MAAIQKEPQKRFITNGSDTERAICYRSLLRKMTSAKTKSFLKGDPERRCITNGFDTDL